MSVGDLNKTSTTRVQYVVERRVLGEWHLFSLAEVDTTRTEQAARDDTLELIARLRKGSPEETLRARRETVVHTRTTEEIA